LPSAASSPKVSLRHVNVVFTCGHLHLLQSSNTNCLGLLRGVSVSLSFCLRPISSH